jgi:hypothetical protein
MTRILKPHAITIGLLLFAAVNFFGTYAASRLLFPKKVSATSASYTKAFLQQEMFDDSWLPMRSALEQLRKRQPVPLYQAVFFEQGIKFQYPPSALLALDLLDRLTGHDTTPDTLNRVSWDCYLLLALIVPVTYILALRKFNPALADHFSAVDLWTQAVSLGAMTLTFYPIMWGVFIGNIQTWLTCLFAGSVLAWICGYEGTAGILIGLIITVKPQLVLLLAWAGIRSRPRFLVACAATLATVEGISLWRYGLNNQFDYLSVLSFLSAHGESYHPNQSMNGLLSRMLHNGCNIVWTPGFPPFRPLVYYGTLLSSILMIGFSLLWDRTKKDEKSILLSFLMTSLLITMASPIAWEHHYGILASIYACLFAILPEGRRYGHWLIWLAISFWLTSNLLMFTDLTADTRWNFIQSYLFGGAGLLVFIVYRCTRVEYHRTGPERSRQRQSKGRRELAAH